MLGRRGKSEHRFFAEERGPKRGLTQKRTRMVAKRNREQVRREVGLKPRESVPLRGIRLH